MLAYSSEKNICVTQYCSVIDTAVYWSVF